MEPNEPRKLTEFERQTLSSFEQMAKGMTESFKPINKAFRTAAEQMVKFIELHNIQLESGVSEDDHVVLPGDDLFEPGVYIVYTDGGLLPQTHKLAEKATADELWSEIEFLHGEDLEPCTVLRYSGTEEYEVLMYRRATEAGDVYRDGWVAADWSFVPEELRDEEPPRKHMQHTFFRSIMGD